MSDQSDNNDKPRTNIFDLLPEVYHSDLNDSLIEASFNRHLTKDDTTRVSGFIGQGNPAALVDRQIQEPTPFRQAYQLQPTMYTRVGRVDHVLTQQGFFNQLELLGVDINRLPEWGNTLQFNWVPPINIDMLINYFDYYWPTSDPSDPPQYITIENRCNKARGKAFAYENVITQEGALHALSSMDVKLNTFVIDGDLSELFTVGFVFFTKNTTDVNLINKFWTTASSTYDIDTNQTTIFTQENIAIVSVATPVTTEIGRLWYKPDSDEIFRWDGASWILIPPSFVTASGDISLTELLTVFQSEANCVCNEDLGWDIGLWDDNQLGAVLWNTALLAAISHPTEAGWIVANGLPADLDLWYDTTNDQLNQYFSGVWNLTFNNFSTVVVLTTGNARWDLTLGCVTQDLNQWSEQNKWSHKSEVQAFGGVKRAQIPIIEYNSTVELNEWVRNSYEWKYRALSSDTFESIGQGSCVNEPWRIELEPVKGYATVLSGGRWYIYFFERGEATLNRDINHTTAFTPGTIFRIVDDGVLNEIFTVASSEYRKIEASDLVNDVLTTALLLPITDYYVTVVEIEEAIFAPPTIGGGVTNVRVEPVLTSQGDTWRGYHVHWLLDPDATTQAPTTAQPLSPILEQSLENIKTGANPIFDVVGIAVGTGDGILEIAPSLIVFTPIIAGITTISLRVEDAVDYTTVPPSPVLPLTAEDDLRYVAADSQFFATPDSNELRVYINNVQQYGNYTENVVQGVPNYTLIGTATTTTATIPYVESITFDEALTEFDVVRIEVGPASLCDVGMIAVPVRTVEDETEFAAAVIAGTQPVYRSLSQFHHTAQVKNTINQYPLFNVYDTCPDLACSEAVVNASPIFAYKELAECPINPYIQKRIFATPDGRDYTFIQYLLDRDDNILYGFRNLDLAPDIGTFWYDSTRRVVYQWEGKAWSAVTFVDTTQLGSNLLGSSLTARTFTVSDTEPTELLTVDGAYWMDSVNEILYQRNIVTVQWDEETNVIIAGADPTLETVWNTGDGVEYVPEYVDENRDPVPVGDSTGDWELLDQWFFNSEHKNKEESKYTQLVTHFRSVIEEQPPVPGFVQGGTFTRTQNDYNYGLGGLMKDHNESFDTLISAINVNNTTPVGLMEWSEDQYGLGLLFVRDFFNTDIPVLYGDFSTESLLNQTQFFSTDIILQYKLNDFLSTVYGDTTAFNADTNVGMPNWIATAPILLLTEKFYPHTTTVDDTIEIFHHDGHRSSITYTPGESDRYSRQIIALPDDRVAGGTLGVLDAAAPPATETDFLTAFGGTVIRTGVYWYQVVGGIRDLYRFIPYAVSFSPPSFFFEGNEIPDGTQYYDTNTDLVYSKVGLSWVAVSGIPFDISSLWEEVNFAEDLAAIVFEIETRLYDAVPIDDLVFDYSTLTVTPADQTEYDRQYERRFNAFVAERNITTPFVNTTYNPSNAFTWNYVNSTLIDVPRLDITPPATAAAWQELYTRWYGTPFPHLEPWKLQGFHDKPLWWDDEYKDLSGTRRWIYTHATTTGMWENIRIGAIPVGEELPDGSGVGTGTASDVSATFNYFCVNIDDVAVGGFEPDEVFPPYLSATTVGFSTVVRSLYSILAAEVFAPDADYAFGDVGPSEWLWTVSPEYVYDIPIIAFLMQPARFLHASFGVNFVDINQLQVETTFCQVYSHEDALFHGDIYNTNETYYANGLNQWYVNFNRSSGYDTSNEFRYLWAGWDPLMSYQFAGIVDTSTFEIGAKFFDLVEEDHNILLANTGVIKDMWAEGFETSVLNIPPAIMQYNNQSQWRFALDSLAVIERELSYYNVRLYPYSIDAATNEGTFYNYTIADVEAGSQRFFVYGNQTLVFTEGLTFDVTGSTLNDGTYTTVSSVFEPSLNRTRLNVSEGIASPVSDGFIDVDGFVSPWVTGQQVAASSSRNLPAPLVNGAPYFIISTGPRTFQLAETFDNALANIPIDILTAGDGELRLGEVTETFLVFGGQGNSREIWYHYALDKEQIITVTPPMVVQGMQTLINVFDGYAEFQRDQEQRFNLTTVVDIDEETGRSINWQFETERFIDWAYGLRRTRLEIADRFEYTLNAAAPTTELLFSSATPVWQNSTPIVFSTTGTLPSPLIAGVPYHFVQTATPGVFNVSITSSVTNPANYVTFTTAGSGTLYVAQHRPQTAFPSLEVNPIRHNIWYDTPQGIMSDIVTGPYTDIRVTQTIFDQHGRALTPDKLNVYRLDNQTRIAIRDDLEDDLSIVPAVLRTDYDNLHLGGGHFFMEAYEHVILFNDYAVGGALIYDQFYGLQTQRFNLDYFEKTEYTFRPTLGGYYLIDGEFRRNIEGSTVDAHNYYDTYDLREGTLPARYSRQLLGYEGTENFLDLVNLNNKSQFLFYKGMIQYKGSVAGASAYINSRRFIDAKIDEYWAWKIAEYGSPLPRIYPQINLFSNDARQQDVRLHFLANSETDDDVDVVDAVDDDFIVVNFAEEERWNLYPEQKAEIVSPLFLDAEVSSMYSVYVSVITPTAGETTVDYWYNPVTTEFKTWDGTTWNVVTDLPIAITTIGSATYVQLTPFFDDARVIQRTVSLAGDLREYETLILAKGGGINEFTKVNSELIKFQTVGFHDIMVFFTINPGFDKINPSKLIDKRADVVVSEVQLWDPARDHHSTVAIHNVDLQNENDPAGYLITKNPDDAADFVWNDQQVGQVWFDSSVLGYKKYYDTELYPDVNDRLNSWGQLADWAQVRVYEWTSSPVPPLEYADIVTDQANDLRPQRSKATGEAKQTLFRRDRTAETATIDGITSGSQPVDFTPAITGATGTGLAVGTIGYQDVDFTTTFVGGDATGLSGTGPFQANVAVDGENYLINVTSVSASTYTDLITQITSQLLGSATASIFDTDTIRITSASVGLGSTVVIQDINLFNSLVDAPATVQIAVDGTSTTYTATFTIDGVDSDIAILGDDAQDFDDLVDVINLQISGVGSIAIDGGDLVVTSDSVGTESTVAITDIDLFSTIFGSNTGVFGTSVVGTYGKVKVPTGLFAEGSQVLFTSTDTLPTGLEAGVKYTVSAVDATTYAPTDDLLDLVDTVGISVQISTVGTGVLSIIPTFTNDWVRVPVITERIYGSIDIVPGTFEPTLILTASVGWTEKDNVDVYINDVQRLSGYTLTSALTVDLTGTNITVEEKDIIDVVRPTRALSADEQDFDPDLEDDGTVFTQWDFDFEYAVFTTYTGSNSTVPTQTYYFWVENSQFRDVTERAGISAQEVQQQLENIPTPYFVVQEPKDDPELQIKYGFGIPPYGEVWSLPALAEQFLIIPVFYRQAVLRRAVSEIAQDDRFVWKFTRDLSLRTKLNNQLKLKNKHEEWFMFRRQQPSSIPRELWDRLTEALMGYTLADSTIRVPLLDRELYDALVGSDTRFGLAEGQAFVDKDYALATILAYLTRPDIDFQPVDIDDFFATYSFDTPENIRVAMDAIYNSFGATNVNNIWFETLSDALATRSKYKELMKTSWIALHGIRVLEVGGLFDD